MNTLPFLCLALTSLSCAAQITPGKLSFALPEHPGRLVLDQGSFEIKQLSAKPNGHEFGVRADDGNLQFLGFLFLVPEAPHMTSESCRDETLKHESPQQAAAANKTAFDAASGAHIALALMIPSSGEYSSIRAFIAKDDLCADLAFTLHQNVTQGTIDPVAVKKMLSTVVFIPDATPTFREVFAYATVEWDKQQLQGAAAAYRDALALVDNSDDPPKWRRITVDQLSMALGMSGDLKQSREVNLAAIAKDPDYPMYYYNLACADAEAGDADHAREHLQQAFARKKNVLAGEKLPAPATDDSFLKLKSNASFWAFVQTLHP